MNWVPFLFFDDVCHRLTKPAFNQVSQLSGCWPSFEHSEKRRELQFRCELNGNQVRYSLWEPNWYPREVTVEDLNLEFDRITDLAFESVSSNNPGVYRRVNRASLREFERVVLPTIAPLVTNCSWPYLSPKRRDQNRFFFNAFKNCDGLNEITFEEQGQESRDFIARQVKLGNVQTLKLSGTGKWPEAENLAETLKKFVTSARFHQLNSPGLLIHHYKLFELFLERALANELKPGAYIVTQTRNFNKSRLLALHPECRDYSGKSEWRIPNSNLRIALRHRVTDMIYGYGRDQITMEVE